MANTAAGTRTIPDTKNVQNDGKQPHRGKVGIRRRRTGLALLLGSGATLAVCVITSLPAARGATVTVTVTVKTALGQRHADKRYLSSNE